MKLTVGSRGHVKTSLIMGILFYWKIKQTNLPTGVITGNAPHVQNCDNYNPEEHESENSAKTIR